MWHARPYLAVHREVSRDGRFVGGGARNQEPDGDTRRRDNDLDRFGPSDQRNTLRPVSLVYCIEYEVARCPLGDPCLSLYTLEGQGYKESSLFGTIQCLAVHAEQRHARLDLVGQATFDGATHVLGAIPPQWSTCSLGCMVY